MAWNRPLAGSAASPGQGSAHLLARPLSEALRGDVDGRLSGEEAVCVCAAACAWASVG